MAYDCTILADSISPAGKRLTTFEITYPRFVHSELMTHRMFSRNSASSRAIPIAKMMQRVMEDPAMPVEWGKNQSGMQAKQLLDADRTKDAKFVWLRARDAAMAQAQVLMSIGAHKQIVNRLLEPWMWMTVIVSATEWANFFALRCHEDAQPEIRKIAEMMQYQYQRGIPSKVSLKGWHLPFVGPHDWEEAKMSGLSHMEAEEVLIHVSVGRCARVSYLTHDGKRSQEEDLKLHDRLLSSGHWSPFEHVATPMENPDEPCGNFIGWRQYRKLFANENITHFDRPYIEHVGDVRSY